MHFDTLSGHRVRRMPLTAALLALLAGTASAQGPLSRNLVYTQTNNPNGNAILAYTRGVDGKLTPLPSGPFPTGGLGLTSTFALGPFDSDQEVILDQTGQRLFTVNGGSNSISVFDVMSDGSLKAVVGSPFSSGGSGPVSIGLIDDILCVVNQNEDPGHEGSGTPNYATFHVASNGRLSPRPRSVYPVEIGSSPSQALTVAPDRLVFGADFLGGILRSFRVGEGGRLVRAAAMPLPASIFAGAGAPPFPLGLAAHPSRNLLYVGFVTINEIGVYEYSDSGAFRFVASAPDSGKAVCWLRTNHDGGRLYASNTADPSITVYDIQTNPRKPVEIQHLNYMSTGGGFQLELDSTGRFLHVVTQQSAPTSDASANAIHVFSIAGDGRLTEVPSSPTLLPVPSGTRPQGIAAL